MFKLNILTFPAICNKITVDLESESENNKKKLFTQKRSLFRNCMQNETG